MATLLETLKSISGYPVPKPAFASIAMHRNLRLEDPVDETVLKSKPYRLAKADVMMWISFAPNIRQSDIQFDLLYSDREKLRKAANAVYEELEDEAFIPETKTIFGYKGSRL
ncbi:MAG: hypothetical protein FWF52_04270 [Candidatus Azobacteroides sp.]|nr:hypothetical protein [Candidatus Azobacteroides sp.]